LDAAFSEHPLDVAEGRVIPAGKSVEGQATMAALAAQGLHGEADSDAVRGCHLHRDAERQHGFVGDLRPLGDSDTTHGAHRSTSWLSTALAARDPE
jgi:hypothetical protein